MTIYVHAVDGTVLNYPYSYRMLQADNPTVSYPREVPDAELYRFDLYPVVEVAKPDVSYLHVAEEVAPVLTDGSWVQTWTIRDATQEEIDQAIADIKQDIAQGTQARLDSFAQTRNYDGILSLCSYAGSPVEKFRLEAEYGQQARADTWQKVYEIEAEAEAGTRPVPAGYKDIESELPPLAWP